MKNYFTILKCILFAGLFISMAKNALGQEPLYNIKFIKAGQFSNGNHSRISAVFLVTPKELKDFPPVVSTKVIYSLGDEPERKADIMHNDNVNITVYDKNIKEKSAEIFELVKDQIDLNSNDRMSIFVFNFRELPLKPVEKMTMTYGFWEKNDQNVRVEKKYSFNVEPK